MDIPASHRLLSSEGEAERLSDWEGSGGWLAWGASAITKPVSWLFGAGGDGLEPQTQLVLPSIVRVRIWSRIGQVSRIDHSQTDTFERLMGR